MLSVIQKQIRKAAIEGNLALFNKLLAMFQATNSATNAANNNTINTFVEYGSVLVNIIEKPNTSPDMHAIVLRILDEYQQARIDLSDGALSVATWEDIGEMKIVENRKLYEWAIQSNAISVLDHPLVQQEMMKDQIRGLVLDNQLEQARGLATQQAVSRDMIYSRKFIEELVNRYSANAQALDTVLAELIEHKELSLSDLDMIAPFGPTMADQIDASIYPKTAKTQAVKLIKAIASLEKEPKDGKDATQSTENAAQKLVALSLMETYFADIMPNNMRSLATRLLTSAIQSWGVNPTETGKSDTIASEKEQIILALLDKYQAEISMISGMPGMPNFHLSYMIDNNMLKTLAHPTVIDLFKRLCPHEQKELLEKAGKYGTNPTVPSEKDLSMAQTLVGHVKKQTFNPAYPITCSKPITLESLAGNLNTLSTVPHKAKAHQRWLQIFGLLLENGLVDDVDTLKKGSHTLKLQDHNRGNATYDLRKYVKDNPVLFTAFSKVATKEQLEKMKKENTVQVTPTVQAAPAQAVTAITPANPAAITATAITPSFAAHAQAQPLNAQYDSIKETLNDFLKKSKGVMTKY
ncbi:MAG: hypothetical protein AB7V32_00700 [Candidatus Berkiella sp.]